MFIGGGQLTMSSTLLVNNSDPAGISNLQPTGGDIDYALPTPPAYWLPNAECVVSRAGCRDANAFICKNNRQRCSLLSGNEANGWQPEDCTPPTFIQTCVWNTTACASQTACASGLGGSSATCVPGLIDGCPLGRSLYFVPYFHVDVTFPYPCAAGFIGSASPEDQTNSNCAGRCYLLLSAHYS